MRPCELDNLFSWLGGLRQVTEERPTSRNPSPGPRGPVCDTITMKTALLGLLLVAAAVLVPGAQAYPSSPGESDTSVQLSNLRGQQFQLERSNKSDTSVMK